MNINEAIKRVELMGEYEPFVDEPISKRSVLNILSQIHKPQKVVIPKFVAEWIERVRKESLHLFDAYQSLIDDDRVKEWFINTTNFDLFARAWLDGYEVEQERLYTVEIPDPNVDEYSIVLGRKEWKVQIKQTFSTTWWMNCSNQLTESEIKKDFEWAWQFAKPVQEEVE